jgi:hypothetical protein
MALIVTKPGGLLWDGVLYETGTALPPDVARAVVQHPNYVALVTNGFIAADGSHEALVRGVSSLKDDLGLADSEIDPEDLDLDLGSPRRARRK